LPTCIVVGGGLAGLAAAAELGRRGHRVTILESKARLGGRAGSFFDPVSGQVVDACQHVSMGCCTEFERFCQTVGVGHLFAPQPVLYFMTPDRRVSRFAADPLPAPFHLARSFLRAHYLTRGDKLRVAWGLFHLRLVSADRDEPFLPWLRRHRQNARTIQRFWEIVLVSALNESVERVGLKYARKVFVDAFLTDRRGFEVQVPTVPLDRLYGDELRTWFAKHGVTIEFNAGVTAVEIQDCRVAGLRLRDGSVRVADRYILAVPAERVAALVPTAVAAHDFRELRPSPIASVHLWWDRPITEYPHVVFVGCLGQWLFNRGAVAPGEHYTQVVVSAARELRGQGGDVARRRIEAELRQLFPAARAAEVVRAKVVIEPAATFAPVPGVDRHRPGPRTDLDNLFLAGDWTDTGWPATMEGAVRSGFAAACGAAASPARMPSSKAESDPCR